MSHNLIALTLDGQLLESGACARTAISPTDRGLLLGDGLFETLPVLGGKALWWEDHFERLAKSAALIDLSLNKELIQQSVQQLAEHAANGNAILRLTVTRGSGGRGLHVPSPNEQTPTVLATLAPFPALLAFADITLATSTIRRNETSPTSRIKSLAYLDNILATREANGQSFEDAIFLNTKGNVACATIGNVFAIFKDRLVTPPPQDGILCGILRQKLLRSIRDWGLRADEISLSLDELKKADGLFVTNSLRIIRRVTRLDDCFYQNSQSDDLIGKLQIRMQDLILKETGVQLPLARLD